VFRIWFYRVFRYFERTPLSIENVLALLRIGTKYMISDLQKEAVSRICRMFPNRLDDWTNIQRDDEPIPMGLVREELYSAQTLWRLAYAASQGHVSSALPAIFLECASFSYVELIKGLSLDVGPDTPTPLLMDMLATIITGKEKLTLAYKEMLFSLFTVSYRGPIDCSLPEKCSMSRTLEAQRRFADEVDLQRFGEGLWKNVTFVDNLCPACRGDALNRLVEGSSRYWDYIPKAFGLGSWSELEKLTE
jgi:hypothetical protein